MQTFGTDRPLPKLCCANLYCPISSNFPLFSAYFEWKAFRLGTVPYYGFVQHLAMGLGSWLGLLDTSVRPIIITFIFKLKQVSLLLQWSVWLVTAQTSR